MSRIIVPQRRVWTRQPPCNTGGVSLPRVSLAWNAATGIDESDGKYVSPVVVSGAIMKEPGKFGIGALNSGGSSFNRTKTAIPNGDYTIVFSGTEGTSNAAPQFAILQINGGAQIAVGLNFSDYFSEAAGRVSLTALQSGVNRSHAYVAGIAGTNNAFRTYLFRRRGTTVSCWIDGVKQTVVSSGGFTGAPAGSADSLRIAGDSANGSVRWGGPNYDAVLLHASVIQTALPDDVCAKLSTTEVQWSIFARRDRRTIIDFGASGTTSVYSDSALTYYVRSMLSSDSGVQYAIRNAIYQDDAVGYYLRNAIAQNNEVGYILRSAIAQDDAEAYKIRGLIQADDAEAYNVRGLVQTSGNETYSIRGAVQTDVTTNYDIQSSTSVASTNTVSYSVRGSVSGDVSPSYAVRGVAQSDVSAGYSLRALAYRDVAASYAIEAAASSVYADLTASYSIYGVAPSVDYDQIAAAVLAQLNATTIPVNVTHFNGNPTVGSGTPADPVRPA